MIDRRFELLKDEVKQSSMWEVNNPRVIKIVTLTMKMIEDDDLFNEEQREQLFFILRAIIKVWGNSETNV
jgi:hypothetical protein|tara:strand:+ start:2119 stop:2328 length:210 start_codon:yes stop_codon:yes gene_type:complete